MKKETLLKKVLKTGALGALLAMPVGEAAWALSLQNPNFAWPELQRAGFWALGGVLGVLCCWGQAWAWNFAFRMEAAAGLKIGVLSLLPCFLGLFWKLIVRFPVPAPHDTSLRKLQILLAAQLISVLWVGMALGILAIRKSGVLSKLGAKKAALRLGGAVLLFYQLNGAWIGQWNMTGDAPHYLLMTHSMAYEGDLDLLDNFKTRDWRRFFDYPWDLITQDPVRPNGQMVPEHKPGLPVLLVPAYRLLDDSGARWMLAFLAALGAGIFYALCLKLKFKGDEALLGWALFGFTAPWLSQSQSVMAELIGGLAMLMVLASWRGLIPAWGNWLSLAFMFWVHIRYAVLSLCMGVVGFFKEPRRWSWQALLPLVFIGMSLGISTLFNQWLFGSADPREIRDMSFSMLFNPAGSLRYGAGILLDQEFGLLPYAPVFLLAPFGLRALWKRDRPWFWQTLLPSLGYFGVVASFPWWWSAMAPNRFVTCLAPVLMLWTLEAWRAWGKRPLFWFLAIVSLAWGWGMAVLPWLSFSKTQGQNLLLRIAGSMLHVDLPAYFPSFILNTPLSYAWMVALLALGTLYWKRLGPPR